MSAHIIHSHRLASHSDLACRLHVNQLNYSGNLRFIKCGLRNLPSLNYVLFQVCALCLSPSFSAEFTLLFPLSLLVGAARGLPSIAELAWHSSAWAILFLALATGHLLFGNAKNKTSDASPFNRTHASNVYFNRLILRLQRSAPTAFFHHTLFLFHTSLLLLPPQRESAPN